MLYERKKSAKKRRNTDDAGVVAAAVLPRRQALGPSIPETISAESVIGPAIEVLIPGSAGREAVSGVSNEAGGADFYGTFAKQHLSGRDRRDKAIN